MKTYNVVPHKGVDPVRLGMSRAESRAAMSLPFTSDMSYLDLPEVDYYHESAFQVFFDNDDRVEYIQLSKEEAFVALYKGIKVHETEAEELLNLICQDVEYDENDPELGYTYIFPTLELGVWRSGLPEDDEKQGKYFMTIGVGKQGYYSSQPANEGAAPAR